MAKRFIVSVSELELFQRCRRRWRLAREWETKLTAPNLWLGTGIHYALEHYYRGVMKWPHDTVAQAENMLAAWDKWGADEATKATDVYGEMWCNVKDAYTEMLRLGRTILTNYLEYEKTAELKFTPLIVERRVFVPVDGGENFVTARMDLIARLEWGDLAIVDHKSASRQSHSGRSLDINEQGTGYVWSIWKATGGGTIPEFVHNTIFKAGPTKPKTLKSGKLSTDKNQHTTAWHFRKAIKESGQREDDYTDMLAYLDDVGWSKFFKRESSPRNEQQVRRYEARAAVLMREMRRALEDDSLAYPCPSPLQCPTCPFLSVCAQMEDGSDWKFTLERNYNRTVPEGGNLLGTPARINKEEKFGDTGE